MDPSDYENLKAEYKAHFKKMKDLKDQVAQKVAESKHTQRIAKAIQEMDAAPVMDSVDEMVNVIREKAAVAEAKISMALDVLFDQQEEDEQKEAQNRAAYEESVKRKNAQDTIARMKEEMQSDSVVSETNKAEQAEKNANFNKTIGSKMDLTEKDEILSKSEIKKTLGAKQKPE